MQFIKKYRALLLLLPVVTVFLLPAPAHTEAATGEASDILLSVDEAIALKKNNPRTIYVDVRSEELFNRSHMPTAINIPLHFVKTKQYLKNMKVILVNEGYTLEPLYKEYERLTQSGFAPSILAGGIAAWSQQGKQLTGSAYPDKAAIRTAPAEIMVPGNRPGTIKLLIDMSATGQGELLADAIAFPVVKKADVDSLLAFISDQALDSKSAVMLFNRDGNYQLLDKLAKTCRPTLFFLQGGTAAYQTALNNTQAMLQPREQRIKKTDGCPTCPPAIESNKEKK